MTPMKWLWEHHHKILIWIIFLATLVEWISDNPDPQKLLDALEKIEAAAG